MKITKEKACSIMESLLFMSPDPIPFSNFETLFDGEISSEELNHWIEELKASYNKQNRGIYLEKVSKGWQLRTKPENKEQLLKIKPQSVFRLSRPSLEVLSIIAYEQACTKMEIDEIRGVESGHLLRTLVEKELIYPSGKSDFPGKPSLYKTTNKFLEIFGFESLKDLPSKEEINALLPQTKNPDKEKLFSVSKEFDETNSTSSYEKDEQENQNIKDILKSLPTTVEFLEKEKIKNRDSSQNTEDPTQKIKEKSKE